MTNNDNNNERENEMIFDDFETTVTNEETQAYSDYVDAEELEAIEDEMDELEDEIDDIIVLLDLFTDNNFITNPAFSDPFAEEAILDEVQ